MALITCENACFAYEGREVIHHLSFAVDAGDYLCVVGENGSGKSTLMKGMLGLLAPSHGRMVYDASLKRTEIGYLPQHCNAQPDFPATVREVVYSGFSDMLPWKQKKNRPRAQQVMELLSIEQLQRQSFMELSGGQQQRVLLARALCAAHRLLLLDEPVAGLDPLITREMYDVINELNRKQGLTVIMISHDVQAALQHANKILHLAQGKSFFGNVAQYRASAFSSGFLGGNADDE